MHLQLKKSVQSQKQPEPTATVAGSSHPSRQPAWTRALDTLPLQAKLTINQPGDAYEQEADRVAAQVMRMPDPAASGARRCACGGEAGPDGECAECRAKRLQRQAVLQPKLTVGAANDPYEQEADRVAAQVLAAPANPTISGAPPKIQRYTGQATGETATAPNDPLERETEDLASGALRSEPLPPDSEQRRTGSGVAHKFVAPSAVAVPPDAPDVVRDALSDLGVPLDERTRDFFEPRFGQDFGAVRVHDDARAAQSAKAINALAYTSGSHIVFGAGQHSAQSDRGRRLLAHELAHVRQGKRGVQCFGDPDQSSLMGLGSLAEVADALLAQVSMDQYPMLAELVAARDHYANSGTLQVQASALAELGQIAAEAVALLPAWVPTPQIALPEAGLAMAQVAINPWTIVIIILVLIILALLYAIWWLWPWLRGWLGFRTEPVEEPEMGTEPGTGDTGEAPAREDTAAPLSCGEDAGEAPRAKDCGLGACAGAEDFCRPYRSEAYATCLRDGFKDNALDAIGGFVGDRVKPVWALYLSGGLVEPKNYSGAFAGDFAEAATTLRAVDFLQQALADDLVDDPPAATHLTESEIYARIGGELDQLGSPGSVNRMNFSDKTTIPGNLAGDTGTEQGACPAGAHPSTAPDERDATIQADIERIDPFVVQVQTAIDFSVRDTVDLCPGNCGEDVEQLATVPFSRYEATGISGDVPFKVNYRVVPEPFELNLPESELEVPERGETPGDEETEEDTGTMQ